MADVPIELPSGGYVGMYLQKASNTDYHTQWAPATIITVIKQNNFKYTIIPILGTSSDKYIVLVFSNTTIYLTAGTGSVNVGSPIHSRYLPSTPQVLIVSTNEKTNNEYVKLSFNPDGTVDYNNPNSKTVYISNSMLLGGWTVL